MKKIIHRIFISGLVFFTSLGAVVTFNGLIAENGDLITLSKWNELVGVLQSKLNNSDIIAGNNITLTNSGNQVIIDSSGGGGSIPFITNVGPGFISPNATGNFTINGIGFTPTSTLEIPGFDGSINTIIQISPTELIANITSGSIESNFDFIINNNGNRSNSWNNNGSDALLVTSAVLGSGGAGTYNEDFESGLGSWNPVTGLTANVSFAVNTGGTPSAGTGPTGASTGTNYIYTETSNPNTNGTFAIETDNFRQATAISFDYHMHGGNMGTLLVQTLDGGVWTTRYTRVGEQQVNQLDPWLNTGNINISAFDVERIRIFFTAGGGFESDLAIDNIVITSI